jgi:hypothetical protein
MTAVEKITEKATEWERPALNDLDRLVRARKPWMRRNS